MNIEFPAGLPDETTAAEVLAAAQPGVDHRFGPQRIGQIRSDGRGAAVNIQLPNGQEFRITVEEL